MVCVRNSRATHEQVLIETSYQAEVLIRASVLRAANRRLLEMEQHLLQDPRPVVDIVEQGPQGSQIIDHRRRRTARARHRQRRKRSLTRSHPGQEDERGTPDADVGRAAPGVCILAQARVKIGAYAVHAGIRQG